MEIVCTENTVLRLLRCKMYELSSSGFCKFVNTVTNYISKQSFVILLALYDYRIKIITSY